MTQLVIPMAGAGSRFRSQGYETPKPLLPIGDFCMFETVIANVWHSSISRIVLVSQIGAVPSKRVFSIQNALNVEVHNVEIEGLSDGPAGSVQLALQYLDPHEPLVVANSDQLISGDLAQFFEILTAAEPTHCIATMTATGDKWSYVRLDDSGHVVEVREKSQISNLATVGIYGFARCDDFRRGNESMRRVNDRTNGEFYVAPVYNYLDSLPKIATFHLGELGEVMHGLGVPEDYENFLSVGPVNQILITARELFSR